MPIVPAGDHARLLTALLTGQEPAIDAAGPPAPASLLPAAVAEASRHSSRPPFCWSARPMSITSLRAIVTSAYATDLSIWPDGGPSGRELVVLLSAHRVSGLPHGSYLASRTGRAAFTAIPGSAPISGLRQLYAAAPALLHICGDVDYACAMTGTAGYGGLLVRAGAFGHAAWLCANYSGLAGASYARTSHHVTKAARLVRPGLRHLMTVAIGSTTPAVPSESRKDGETAAG